MVAGELDELRMLYLFQSPRGDFGFLKAACRSSVQAAHLRAVSIPSRGFWFFEGPDQNIVLYSTETGSVSIPSRGFWFFEGSLP